jgi:Flp pilus assembly protein TadD
MSMKRTRMHRSGATDAELDPIEVLVSRARRLHVKGDPRRALVLLREAAARDEWRARTFTILGARLIEARRYDEARSALRHACWLRSRAGERGRAAATERLLARVSPAAA